jgi:hypothetical protein
MKSYYFIPKPFFMKTQRFPRCILLLLAVFTGSLSSSFALDIDLLSKQLVNQHYSDTIPSKREKSISQQEDMDKAMGALKQQMSELNAELKKIDYTRINKEVTEALAQVNVEKIRKETGQALKNIDLQEINTRIEHSLKEAQEAIAKIDTKQIQKELNESLNTEKIREEISKGMEKAEKGMEKAQKGMEKAQEEMENLHEFTVALEKDGLIDTKKGYRVRVEDGKLYINGTVQPKDVYEKYKSFYKNGHMSFQRDGNKFSVL